MQRVTRPNAAEIDVGDTMHAVAVPPGRDKEQVKIFGAFTYRNKSSPRVGENLRLQIQNLIGFPYELIPKPL